MGVTWLWILGVLSAVVLGGATYLGQQLGKHLAGFVHGQIIAQGEHVAAVRTNTVATKDLTTAVDQMGRRTAKRLDLTDLALARHARRLHDLDGLDI